MNCRRTVAAILLLLSMAVSVDAQPARLSNGRVEAQVVTTPLEPAVRRLVTSMVEPAWIGYAVKAADGDRRMCCWDGPGADGCCGVCRLEPGAADGVSMTRRGETAIPLERGDLFYVLARVEHGQVERIRMFSADCALDAGGRTLYWMTGVRDTDSVAWLATFLGGNSSRRLVDSVLGALAMHAAEPAIDRLIDAARSGGTAHTRGQALFWLSQRASHRTIGVVSDAVTRDPDIEVKKRAVFALSQLPADEGVPRLIQVARAHSVREVRKQAMFWLGQSKDARALAFFAEVLGR